MTEKPVLPGVCDRDRSGRRGKLLREDDDDEEEASTAEGLPVLGKRRVGVMLRLEFTDEEAVTDWLVVVLLLVALRFLVLARLLLRGNPGGPGRATLPLAEPAVEATGVGRGPEGAAADSKDVFSE
jgi:hypothetical protein